MSWQNWSDKDFLEFLKEFYLNQLELAAHIVEIEKREEGIGSQYLLAVFEKIAPPAVYLEDEYKIWLTAKQGKQVIETNSTVATEVLPEKKLFEPQFQTLTVKLPWRNFKRQPCKRGEPGWIFTNTKNAENLRETIQKMGGAFMVIDGVKMTLKFSGNNNQFINRYPWKEST